MDTPGSWVPFGLEVESSRRHHASPTTSRLVSRAFLPRQLERAAADTGCQPGGRREQLRCWSHPEGGTRAISRGKGGAPSHPPHGTSQVATGPWHSCGARSRARLRPTKGGCAPHHASARGIVGRSTCSVPLSWEPGFVQRIEARIKPSSAYAVASTHMSLFYRVIIVRVPCCGPGPRHSVTHGDSGSESCRHGDAVPPSARTGLATRACAS